MSGPSKRTFFPVSESVRWYWQYQPVVVMDVETDINIVASRASSPTGVSAWLLLNANSAIFQLYHGENNLLFNEMMMKSPIGQAVILVIMYVGTFKTDVIIFFGKVTIDLMSRWSIFLFSIRVSPLILTISSCKVKRKMSKL
jgi:hypothetical protein